MDHQRQFVSNTEMAKNKKMFSLNKKTLTKLLIDTIPAAQGQSENDLNIGFGFLYYSLSRILRPKTIVVLGSLKGFSPLCFSLGLKDNQSGKLYFVDAGYSDKKQGKKIASGGRGFWNNKKEYQKLLKSFGVTKIISSHIVRTSEFLKFYKTNHLPPIDILYIDANHTYEGFKYDYENYIKLLSDNGIVVFHDALVDENNNGYTFGVKKYYEEIISQNVCLEKFRVNLWPGVVIMQKSNVPNQIFDNLNSQIHQKDVQLYKIYNSKLWKILWFYKTISKLPINFYKRIIIKNKIKIIINLPISRWAEFRNLRLEALKDSPQAFVDKYQTEFELADNVWQDRLIESTNKNNQLVFAELNNKLVGMAAAVQNSDDVKNKSVTICRFYINNIARGSSTSDKLLKHLLYTLKNNYIKSAHLFVSDTQTSAINLYKRNGFTTTNNSSMMMGNNQTYNGFEMEIDLSNNSYL